MLLCGTIFKPMPCLLMLFRALVSKLVQADGVFHSIVCIHIILPHRYLYEANNSALSIHAYQTSNSILVNRKNYNKGTAMALSCYYED